jgi:signal transduction histidine kinase
MLSLPEKRAIWDTITSGYEWKGEFQHNSKDNKIIWESASVSPIINEHGITTHYLAIFQDITKRKIQEEQLVIEKEKAEQSDRLKSEFLSQISHEVRTPLNNILTYISLLKEEFEEMLPTGMESAFSVINSSSKRLIRTIELILNLSRIQTGNFETNFEVLDLDKDLIEDLVLEFYSRAKFKNLGFKYENKAKNTMVKGDQYSLGQIFVNLIDNAIKYTDRGEIRIDIIDKNDKIDVNIIDTGIGISKEFLPRIFDPFMQEDTGKHRNIEGTGLGLALVKKYIELNNIEINVESEKGKGSTFTVSFTPVEKEKIT